jgi:hypothetical protein
LLAEIYLCHACAYQKIEDGNGPDRQHQVYNAETVSGLFGRWIKLHKDLYSKKNGFDLSKIPDLYDCVKFDAIHVRGMPAALAASRATLPRPAMTPHGVSAEKSCGGRCAQNVKLQIEAIPELFYTAKQLADFVIPSEYGVTAPQKKDISRKIGSYMFRVIAHHLRWARKEQESTIDEQHDDDIDWSHLRSGTRLDASYGMDSLLKGLQTPERQVRQSWIDRYLLTFSDIDSTHSWSVRSARAST